MEPPSLESLAALYQCDVLEHVPDDYLDADLVRELPIDFLRSRPMLPIRRDGEVLLLCSDPDLVAQHPELNVLLGDDPEPILAMENVVNDAIQRCFSGLRKQEEEEPVSAELADAAPRVSKRGEREDLLRVSEDAPVAARVSRLMVQALEQGASDIHLDPRDDRVQVRFRIDGVLYEQASIPSDMEDALVSRIKIMGRLDIAERRLPQDGNARVSVGAREVDIRVSTIPVSDGERVVLRLLGRESAGLSLSQLGMSTGIQDRFRTLLNLPYGVVWVTGPTGAGKTTTLYAALRELDTNRSNILTIEDPVEYQLPSIGQMNVQPRIGLSFASGLRHILRQDPDVILVGETRDEETAEIVVRASMTGHLVLSTLHANDAVSASLRLVDMGVAPYLVAEATRGAMAQRLVRKICPHCAERAPASSFDLPAGFEFAPDESLPVPVGCSECREGYSGRIGLYELLEIGPEIQEAIRKGMAPADVQRRALQTGFSDLWLEGMNAVRQGLTSAAELGAALGGRQREA